MKDLLQNNSQFQQAKKELEKFEEQKANLFNPNTPNQTSENNNDQTHLVVWI